MIKQLGDLTVDVVLLFIIPARSYRHAVMMEEDVTSSSGRTSPDEPVIVPVTPLDEHPKPAHSWTASMASLYELSSLVSFSVWELVIAVVVLC